MRNSPKVYLVCGSGGVGKTTVAASLGLKEMTKGHKTLVITIDPAKRLANALGLKSLSGTPKKIDLDHKTGELWAMMLDTKNTFDKLIKKHAKNKKAEEIILNNFLYQNLSEMIAGSQDYMAMEKLFEIWSEKKFDVIIIDTPPVQNAIDFLEAPKRMSGLIDHSLVKWFAKPAIKASQTGWNFFERGSKSIFKVLGLITGGKFLEEIRDFFVAFSEMMSGFKNRALEIQNLLQSSESEFLFVCSSEESSTQSIKTFWKKIKSENYNLSHIIMNRFYAGKIKSKSQILKDEKELHQILNSNAASDWIENYKTFLPRLKDSQNAKDQLQKDFADLPITTIPLLETDVHSLDGLKTISNYLNN